MKNTSKIAIAVCLAALTAPSGAHARGFGGGGGFRGGGFSGGGFSGGGFRGGGFEGGGFGGGGFRGGGFEGGGFQGGGYRGGGFEGGGFEGGGFRGGGFEGGGFSGDRSGGYSADRVGGFNDFSADRSGGYRADGFDNFRGSNIGDAGNGISGFDNTLNRGNLNSFLGLPTDAGLHAAGNDLSGLKAPAARIDNNNINAARVNADRPNELRPNENRPGGIANRPMNDLNHPLAEHGIHSEGYRPFSPTYMHAQRLACQNWYNDRHFFTAGWINNHHWGWCPWGWTPFAWADAIWAPCLWVDLAPWIAFDGPPVYYSYGDNITFQNDYVYYGTQPIETEQQYYQSAYDLSSTGANEPANDAKWLPLGVFGLMPQGQTAPQMVFQLAVDKDGKIRGNYYDQVSDTTLPVHGAVDKKNQRVAWQVGDNKNLVVETGLYNLTKDESPALVHFGPTSTVQELLVRINKPSKDEAAAKPASN